MLPLKVLFQKEPHPQSRCGISSVLHPFWKDIIGNGCSYFGIFKVLLFGVYNEESLLFYVSRCPIEEFTWLIQIRPVVSVSVRASGNGRRVCHKAWGARQPVGGLGHRSLSDYSGVPQAPTEELSLPKCWRHSFHGHFVQYPDRRTDLQIWK